MRLAVVTVAIGVMLLSASAVIAAETKLVERDGIRIDIPVHLNEPRVVFNLDHTAFEGDEPIGLQFMNLMVRHFQSNPVKWQIVAIFHGANAYIALNDTSYDRERHWKQGNPYKSQIEALQNAGAQIELCAETMRLRGWRNDDVLPGIKINGGANFRLIQLIQQGFTEIHP